MTDTTVLAADRTGSGEPLLLMHGFGSARQDLSRLAEALSDGFDVLNVDLPGVGESEALTIRPTVGAITDAVERTLDAHGVGTTHVLGNSLGARVGLELARRGRARSVVAVSPSGGNVPPERLVQGAGMALARLVGRTARPLLAPLSRSAVGRTALLLPLKTRPWAASPGEALSARDGFSDSRDYWRTLLFGLLLDVPRGMRQIQVPVLLVQGTGDWIASGQTLRYRPFIPGSRFRPLPAAGHAPASDRPSSLEEMVRETARRALE